MSRRVSAREANQQFSEILGKAAEGETVVITRRGEPVAQLMPYRGAPKDDRESAWDRLTASLEKGLKLGGGKFRRDDLYDR